MKAYKGFNKDMTCRGFQFEEGKTYHEEEAELCQCGFHACEDPLDCLQYYPPATSIYREVELNEVSSQRENDSKVVGKTIKIGAKVDFTGIIKASIEYRKEKAKKATADGRAKKDVTGYKGCSTSGDSGCSTSGDRGCSTSGDRGYSTSGYGGCSTSGYSGCSTSGDRGYSTSGDGGCSTSGDGGCSTSGYSGCSTSGDRGYSTSGYGGYSTSGDGGCSTSGDRGYSTSGDGGCSTSGDRGYSTSGDGGCSTSGSSGCSTSGDSGCSTSRGASKSGINGVSVARGNGCKVRGGLGALLVIAEENDSNYEIKEWKAVVVDGEKIKPDVWYTLQDGELVEVEADE